jgi:hypothetical protein
MIIYSDQMSTGRAVALKATDAVFGDGPLEVQVAQTLVDEVTARRVPSVRAIRAQLHVKRPSTARRPPI